MKAAIELLNSALNAIKEKAPDEPILKDFEQAIHVLEAAEKIDKGNAMEIINDILTMDEVESGYAGEDYKRGLLETGALLESLPDNEPE
jgi:hypothetical protein